MKIPSLFSMFEEFCKIPKGILVDEPDQLIFPGFHVAKIISKLLDVNDVAALFSRRTLKHLSEKGSEGRLILVKIPRILHHPDFIYAGFRGRLIVVRATGLEKEGQYYVVILEKTNDGSMIIVTSFVAKQKYLKGFKILWRTAASL